MKVDSEDIIFAIAALFAALGLYYPGCLVLAFFILLIPLRQNVKRRKKIENDANNVEKAASNAPQTKHEELKFVFFPLENEL